MDLDVLMSFTFKRCIASKIIPMQLFRIFFQLDI